MKTLILGSYLSLVSSMAFAQNAQSPESTTLKLVLAHHSALASLSDVAVIEAKIDANGTAAEPFAVLKRSLAKVSTDSALGIAQFKETDVREFKYAQTVTAAAMSRSSLARLRTALEGQNLGADVEAALQRLGVALDNLARKMGSSLRCEVAPS